MLLLPHNTELRGGLMLKLVSFGAGHIPAQMHERPAAKTLWQPSLESVVEKLHNNGSGCRGSSMLPSS